MLSPKRAQNSWPAKAMTRPFKSGKRVFSCPFARIKANPCCKRIHLLGEDLINIITPLGAEKAQKGIRIEWVKSEHLNPVHARVESG